MTLNAVHLYGRVKNKPEARNGGEGKSASLTFNLEIKSNWRKDIRTNTMSLSTVEVVYYGTSAQLLARSVVKGSRLIVNGELSSRIVEDKQTWKKHLQVFVNGSGFELVEDVEDVREHLEAEEVKKESVPEPVKEQPTLSRELFDQMYPDEEEEELDEPER
jgi:single-stranded DNA-binding protein